MEDNWLENYQKARSPLIRARIKLKISGQIPYMRSQGGSPRCPVRLVTDLRVSRGKIIRRRPEIRLDRRISPGRVLSRFRGSLCVEPSTPLFFYHPDCGGCANVPTCGHVLDKMQASSLVMLGTCCTRAVRWQPRFMETAEERHRLVTFYNY